MCFLHIEFAYTKRKLTCCRTNNNANLNHGCCFLMSLQNFHLPFKVRTQLAHFCLSTSCIIATSLHCKVCNRLCRTCLTPYMTNEAFISLVKFLNKSPAHCTIMLYDSCHCMVIMLCHMLLVINLTLQRYHLQYVITDQKSILKNCWVCIYIIPVKSCDLGLILI